MSDLDILCSPDDLEALIALADDMGFSRIDERDPDLVHHAVMEQEGSGRILELHFQPYPQIRNPERFMQSAWRQRQHIEIEEVACPVLSPEMSLIFNLAHLFQHDFDVSLKHYLDIAGLLIFYETELNWDDIHSLVEETGLQHSFVRTLRFISCMLDRPLNDREWPSNAQTKDQEAFNTSMLTLLSLLNEPPLKLDHLQQTGWKDLLRFAWGFRAGLANCTSLSGQLDYVRNGLSSLLLDLSHGEKQKAYAAPQDRTAARPPVVSSIFRFITKGHLRLAIERTAAKNRLIHRIEARSLK